MKTILFTVFLQGWAWKINKLSDQKSRRIVPAIQACFLMLRITEILRKWPQSGANRPAQNHQKSKEINIGTCKGTLNCTLAPNDHQNDAKVVPQGPKSPPKWWPRSIKNLEFWMQICLKPDLNSLDLWMQICLTAYLILQKSWMIQILQILQILQIHSDFKLQICWFAGGPAAGAKP